MQVAVGIDIGGSHIGVGIIELAKGRLLNTTKKSHKVSSPEVLVSEIVSLVNSACSSLTNFSIYCIGIGCPGQTKNGYLVAASNFPGWNMVPLADLVSEKFSLVHVVLLNDADAALAAEIWSDESEKPFDNVAMISTGIGVSLLVNGQLYGGSHSLIEGGHSIVERNGRPCPCGQNGCVEAYSSAPSIVKRFWETNPPSNNVQDDSSPHNARLIFERAAAGESIAEKIIDETAEYLALLCINISRIVDPEAIIIGGGVAAAGPAFLHRISTHIAAKCWRVLPNHIQLRLSRSSEDSGIIGAALAARKSFFSSEKNMRSEPTAHRSSNNDITALLRSPAAYICLTSLLSSALLLGGMACVGGNSVRLTRASLVVMGANAALSLLSFRYEIRIRKQATK